jgi:hypothetical protein
VSNPNPFAPGIERKNHGRHRMRSYPKLLTVCLSILLQAAASQALAVRGGSLTFADMLRGMATGLALLGQAGSVGAPALAYPQVPVYPVPIYPPAYPWPVAPPYAAPYDGPHGAPWGAPTWPPAGGQSVLELLQGAWQSDNGGLLLVKDNLARLYLSRDRYQDLYLRADTRYLWLRPAGTPGRTMRYTYRVHDDRLELYDWQGNSLILRRYRPKSNTPHRDP